MSPDFRKTQATEAHHAAYETLKAAPASTFSSPDEKIALLRFVAWFGVASDVVHTDAVNKGWWEQDRNDGEALCLVHSEVSECLEAIRNGNPPDDKCPAFTNTEIEAADAIIRLMDLAAKRGWRLGAALVTKLLYNRTRPHRHGNKPF